ncbi:uncharacterized protein TNCV_4849161 [Trichonephila clavipes]|nr:uncharacterized protein TNCV_4849161 [Trichonephila clavipes]
MAVNISLFSSRTYRKCTKLLHKAYGTAADTLLREVHSEVRKAFKAPTDVPVVDLSVSFDGSWLTRGHTSLFGIACLIDILTSYIIDFEVMCKVCRNCYVAKRELGESSVEYVTFGLKVIGNIAILIILAHQLRWKWRQRYPLENITSIGIFHLII